MTGRVRWATASAMALITLAGLVASTETMGTQSPSLTSARVKVRGFVASYRNQAVSWTLVAVPVGKAALPVCGARATFSVTPGGSAHAVAVRRWTFNACAGPRRWRGAFSIKLRPGTYSLSGEVRQTFRTGAVAVTTGTVITVR